jgi:glycosyltransferase involved in cell wall biosynthesis
MSIKKNPLVSVVIPSYNHSKFIGRAIKSVLTQTYENFEIIIIDNHSEDDTDKILKKIHDHRIRVIKIYNKGIIAASRNKGIKEAKGEWVAFLDSDDIWYPRKLEVLIDFAKKNPNYDLMCSDELRVDRVSQQNKLQVYGPVKRNIYRELVFFGNFISTSSVIIKKNFLVRSNLLFREKKDFITSEDYDFWILLAAKGAKFKFIHKVLGEYIIHEENNSRKIDNHLKNTFNVIKSFEVQGRKYARTAEARLNLSYFILSLQNKNYDKAFLYFKKSVSISLIFTIDYFFYYLTRKIKYFFYFFFYKCQSITI